MEENESDKLILELVLGGYEYPGRSNSCTTLYFLGLQSWYTLRELHREYFKG
jgi:hypothetical protein